MLSTCHTDGDDRHFPSSHTILGWITRERGHCDNYALYSARVYTYLRNSSNVDKHHAIDSNYMRGEGVTGWEREVIPEVFPADFQ
jgi:hypothetical protein